ncbi:hypothetical protein [Ewingella americana]|uniref:Uncharacterized protein n=1 Tax=Ewingella americana TaxID=41202 RepID=A0A502GDY1_9GAMM|nr:hypothetical protein [Ewingella americana]TPG60115.1 hypothetical protein EAH77_16230 [Ewingella americana]
MSITKPMYFDNWNPRKSLINLLGVSVCKLVAVPYEMSEKIVGNFFNIQLKSDSPSSWMFNVRSHKLGLDMDIAINRGQLGRVILITLKRKCSGGHKMRLLNVELESQDAEDAIIQCYQEQCPSLKEIIQSGLESSRRPKPNSSGQLELNLA